MKIYVKLLFARIELLKNLLETYKKWEDEMNSQRLSKDSAGDTNTTHLCKNVKKVFPKSGSNSRSANLSNTKSTAALLAAKSVASIKISADPATIEVFKHPSVDPMEFEKRLVDLYFSLPSPSPETITNLLLVLDAPLSKINPNELLDCIKHERSKELLQEPVNRLLNQVYKREMYLQAQIAKLEKELKDLRKSIEDNDILTKKSIMPTRSARSVVTIPDQVERTSVKKSLKILEKNYDALQNLEWKEDAVSGYLENLEMDLQEAILSLKLILS